MNETVLKIAFPGILFVFAVSIVVQALQMSGPLVETNAHIYPLVVAALLAVGAVGSMVGAVRGTDESGEAAPEAIVAAAPAAGSGAVASAPAGAPAGDDSGATSGAASGLMPDLALATGLTEDDGLAAEETDEEAAHVGRNRVLVVLAASVLYPLVMPTIGFYIATVLYASGLSFLLQDRTRRGVFWAVVAGLGVTLFCHLAFVVMLGARLPSGSVL